MEIKMAIRKRYTAEKKVEILREHLKNKIPVTEICSKYGITPAMFYRWEKDLFEGAIETFSSSDSKKQNHSKSAGEKKLEEKITKQQEVIG
jgi:transposase-like protein